MDSMTVIWLVMVLFLIIVALLFAYAFIPTKEILLEMQEENPDPSIFTKYKNEDNAEYTVKCQGCKQFVWDKISILTRKGYYCQSCWKQNK